MTILGFSLSKRRTLRTMKKGLCVAHERGNKRNARKGEESEKRLGRTTRRRKQKEKARQKSTRIDQEEEDAFLSDWVSLYRCAVLLFSFSVSGQRTANYHPLSFLLLLLLLHNKLSAWPFL